MRDLKKNLLDLHINQDYGELDYEPDYGRLISTYETFPNEAAYVVDCKKAEILPLSNKFQEITECGSDDSQHLYSLYEHTERSLEESFLNATYKLVSTGFRADFNHVPEKDHYSFIYKSKSGKTILKKTCLLQYDSKGIMNYSLGQLIDVTDFVPYTGFKFKAFGDNANKINAILHDLEIFHPILSNRELEILILISKGWNSKRIAAELFISKDTVSTHRKNILKKLEANNATHAFRLAVELGLIDF